MHGLWRAFVLALLGFWAASAAPALRAQPSSSERYALVVGVSSYRNNIRQLQGPRNDVTLLVNTLLEQGVPRDHIRVFADTLSAADYATRVTADGDPTKANILAGFDWLAGLASEHADVLIFLAGHGTQTPAPEEADGLNELFVPIDARRAPTLGAAPLNTISDDEFQPKLAAILNKGAEVWFVVDACHSGTLSRAAESDRVARYVPPEQLGISSAAIEAARAQAAARGGTELRAATAVPVTLNARFVGFYAAQAEQVTYESPMPFDIGDPNQRRVQGEFTWALVSALRSKRFSSYGAVARAVISGYWRSTHGDVAPFFEGSLDMTPMLGTGRERVVPLSVRDHALYLGAGEVDEVGEGASVEILDLGKSSNVVGHARVAVAGLGDARLEITDQTGDVEGVIQRALTDPERRNVERLSARVDAGSVNFIVRVARPSLQTGTAPSALENSLLAKAQSDLDALVATPPERRVMAVQLVDPHAAADIYPIVSRDRLWLSVVVMTSSSTVCAGRTHSAQAMCKPTGRLRRPFAPWRGRTTFSGSLQRFRKRRFPRRWACAYLRKPTLQIRTAIVRRIHRERRWPSPRGHACWRPQMRRLLFRIATSSTLK
jgi:hypothetical protein